MGTVGVDVIRGGLADVRAQDQQRRLVGLLGGVQCSFQTVEIVGHLTEFDDVPVVGTEPRRHVVVGREARWPVDRDLVVVEHADQFPEAEMSGERGRFVRDALHEAAVAGDDEGVVVLGVGPKRARSLASAIAMPTALAKPWPSGPVVTSTPAVWPASGCPGVAESHWRNAFRSSSSRPYPDRKSIEYCMIEA